MQLINTILALISTIAAVVSIPISLKAKSISKEANTKADKIEQEVKASIALINSNIDNNQVNGPNAALINIHKEEN